MPEESLSVNDKFKVHIRLTCFSNRVSLSETENGSVSKFTLILKQRTKQPIQFHMVLLFQNYSFPLVFEKHIYIYMFYICYIYIYEVNQS